MRIGIDARCLEWQEGGPARFLINMLKLWPKMNKEHEYVLFFQKHIPDLDFLENDRYEKVLIKGPKILKTRRIVAEQLLMPGQLKKSRIDLYFTPWYSAPLMSSCPKTVIGCWDVSCNTHPSHYNFLERISFAFFSLRSCRKADGILTCSNYDARQIEKYFSIPSKRICVVPYAVDEKFKPSNDTERLEAFRKKYNLPKRYFLSMGIILKRRNVDVVIDAFKEVYQEDPDIGLVVIGRNSTNPYVDIEAKMRPLVENGRGLYLTRAPEEDIVDFYRAAWYYICTSTTDGESLMLKEAMRSGTPVVTSPLLEETVGGNAIILNDPTDLRETANIVRRVMSNEKMRNEYAAKGCRWAESLSWNHVARNSLEFMENC